MLKIIPIAELRPGMQVIKTDEDWTKRPYLYNCEHLIRSREEVERIIADGYKEAAIDLDRSEASVFTSGLSAERPAAPVEDDLPPPPKVLLEEELPKAVKVHDQGVAYARKFLDGMRKGRLDVSGGEELMTGVLESVERNADALISLSRLHRSDTYTYTHCMNVAVLSTVFARFSRRSELDIFTAGLTGLFHDLGKALVPLTILNAPRKLTEAEFSIMRRHPELGYEQLAKVPGIKEDVLRGALEHHEQFNGNGYPKRLSGEAISPIGRASAICDVYDALTSRRVYKGAMYPHKALGIMYQMGSKEFDPRAVATFIRMLGIYPVGSVVELADGSKAVVAVSNPREPKRPTIQPALDPQGKPWKRGICVPGNNCPEIVGCIPAEAAALEPLRVLGLPV